MGDNCETLAIKSKCREFSDVCQKPSKCAELIDGGITCQNCTRSIYNDKYCRLLARSFSPGTYVAFPTLTQRNFLNISLEFATQNRRGMILYSGRLNGENDFISLEYRENDLIFKYSMGGGMTKSVTVSNEEGFSDGVFHKVEIEIDDKGVVLSYDDCDKKLSLNYGAKLELKWKCANITKFNLDKCNPYLGNCRKSFDFSGPVLLGGIPQNKIKSAKLNTFVGCIRNFYIDTEIIDMNNFVHNNGSVSGCPEKRKFCQSNPCKNNGKCVEGWGSYLCKCPGRWTGKTCNYKSQNVIGFVESTEVTYKKDLFPITLPWYNVLSFKTKKLNGTILVVKVGGGNDLSMIRIVDGFIKYTFKNTDVSLVSKRVNDGEWHNVQIKWMSNEVWLNLDYGQEEITRRSHDRLNEKIATHIKIHNYNGCVQNVRVGKMDDAELKVALQKNTKSCSEIEKTSLSYNNNFVNNCPLKDVLTNTCLDFCDLNLCEKGSRCMTSKTNNYNCVLFGKTKR